MQPNLLGEMHVQVYLMDKRFVDPRRPKGNPTADEKLEMLPPYADELEFTASLFASHKEAIEGLQGGASNLHMHFSLISWPVPSTSKECRRLKIKFQVCQIVNGAGCER